ncbi:hypothetical protein Tco_0337108 [Tanacetum coccineum]
MPYPRFTKVIIHHFMSQHKSISKRQGSPYHKVDKDGVLDRLKFISKEEIHQVYGKSILNTLITDEIQNSEAYKTFIGLSAGLIPLKIGKGTGAHGSNATVTPKKAIEASKKKNAKKIESISKKKSTDPSQKLKLKGIELLSDAAQLEIDTHRAIKANKRESIFQHKSGGSSEGASLGPEVLDEPKGKSAISNKGVGTSPEVPDETKYKHEAQDDLDDWGSTDDETFLFDDKEENPEDISWVSTNEDEYDDKEKEDDESIDIEMTDDEKTDIDVEDQVKGVAEMNIVEEAEEENAEKVKEQKAYEELKANEEQQGDD